MTARQALFLALYLADPKHNATRAAAAAGYAWPSKQGPRLKTLPGIAAAIRTDREQRWREFDERHKAEERARLARLRMIERAMPRGRYKRRKRLWKVHVGNAT